jgi:hypothetical protein
MYAGVLIDELIKQVEHVEEDVLRKIFGGQGHEPAPAISISADKDSHSNHFNGPLAGTGTAEGVRPHGKF